MNTFSPFYITKEDHLLVTTMNIRKKNKTLKQICEEFNVEDVYELDTLQLEEDQKTVKQNLFNENDEALVINKIKDALLCVDLDSLEPHEKQVVQNMLWLWYHHATTVALWKDRDLRRASELCDKALLYLHNEHPNKITPLIRLLLSHEIRAARTWVKTEVNEVEKEYALYLLHEYEKGVFHKKSPSR